MSNGNETPLKVPPGYDLGLARTCSFIVNVACEMCEQWIADGKPAERAFSWTPADSCPVTSPGFPLDDWTFKGPLWSTFTPEVKKVSEPFAIFAYGAETNTTFLAFRGSQTDVDFIMDGKFELNPYKPPTASPVSGIEVEKGFSRVFDGFDHGTLMGMFSTIAGSKGTLILTGHSLGSTLATLSVPLARSAGIPSANILHYNQASPKVGNLEFQIYYDSLNVQTFRLVNTYDIVPDLPPGPYQPVGVQAPFGADYPTKPECHNPCCSYSYALFNPNAPYNQGIETCMEQSNPEFRIP